MSQLAIVILLYAELVTSAEFKI